MVQKTDTKDGRAIARLVDMLAQVYSRDGVDIRYEDGGSTAYTRADIKNPAALLTAAKAARDAALAVVFPTYDPPATTLSKASNSGFTLPSTAFIGGTGAVTVDAKLSNGSALPTGVTWDAATSKVSVASNATTATITVRFTATDSAGTPNTAYCDLALTIAA